MVAGGHAIDVNSISDIVEDRFGEWVRALKDYADAAAQMRNVLGKDVFAVEQDLPLDAGAAHGLMHAVEGANERGLAATGRADEGGYTICGHMQINVVQSMHLAVIEIKVADLHPQRSLDDSLRATWHRRFQNSIHMPRHRTPWGVRLIVSRFY